MSTEDGAIRLPLNVAPPVLDETGLPQHVAFACRDVVALAVRARDHGLRFLPVPANYYDDLAARFGLPAEQISRAARAQPALRPRRSRASSCTSTPPPSARSSWSSSNAVAATTATVRQRAVRLAAQRGALTRRLAVARIRPMNMDSPHLQQGQIHARGAKSQLQRQAGVVLGQAAGAGLGRGDPAKLGQLELGVEVVAVSRSADRRRAASWSSTRRSGWRARPGEAPDPSSCRRVRDHPT